MKAMKILCAAALGLSLSCSGNSSEGGNSPQSSAKPATSSSAATESSTSPSSSSSTAQTGSAATETSASAAGERCGETTCAAGQQCCVGMPFRTPTCFDGAVCPKSRRSAKRDITYLSEADASELSREVLDMRIARYRYKADGETGKEHLGFIIDDVEPSLAVTGDGDHVDLYGFLSMAVLTLQTQEKRIQSLEAEVAELRKTSACSSRP
ncbi:MAG: tail fiber domain-containing protein [Polyangiaceae bacterium]